METEKKTFLKKVTEFDKDGQKESVRFVLGNGQEVIVDMTQVSKENMYHAAVHGISQRLGDACSSFSKDSDYASAFEAMDELRNVLYTAEWSRKREGGAGRQDLEDLIAALVVLKKVDEEVVRLSVAKATPETLKKWRANTTVAAEIADLRKKRAVAAKKAKGDTIDDITFD